jgi:glyoxylase-like metal-dependent hydrolase (beta-lactamase superfamily II)
MPTWLRRTLLVVGFLLVLAGAAYYGLIVESHAPDATAYRLDLERVRALVAAVPGEKPTAIELEHIGTFNFPATAIVAGDGWDNRELPVYAYRLVYPDSSIIVDTALDQAIGGSELTGFDAEAFARLQAAMSQAAQIVITHEHMDHIGGLTVHGDLPAVLTKARLTREQIADPGRSLPAKFPERALNGYQPLVYDDYLAIAPGVAVIKAAGHTPGSQMVYVQTANGTEVLLIGDVAWHLRNIETQRQRARLVTMVFIQEDRSAVFGQLAALKQVHDAQPPVHVVPGHDGKVIARLVEAGILKPRFSLQASGTDP